MYKLSTIKRKERNSDEFIYYPVGLHMHHNLPIIKEMASMIKDLRVNEIILCCSGSSGSIIASLIFNEIPELIANIWHFKKVGENAHCSGIGFKSSDSLDNEKFNFIIVDDFTHSGRTVNYIYSQLVKHYKGPIKALCVSHMDMGYAFIDFEPKIILGNMKRE